MGDEAEELLRPSPFDELKVQILYMDGYEPKARAIDSLRSFLDRYLKKPAGIEVATKKVDSPGKSEYSVEDLNGIIDEHHFHSLGSDRIRTYLLVVDGSFSGDDGNATTLGLAFRAQRMALFGKPVHENSDEVTEPSRWKLEGAVMNHEFGHILGLVANGTPMVNEHRDDGNGAHCENSDCLMYHTVETTDIVGNLVGSGIPKLDANCKKDLEANGGR